MSALNNDNTPDWLHELRSIAKNAAIGVPGVAIYDATSAFPDMTFYEEFGYAKWFYGPRFELLPTTAQPNDNELGNIVYWLNRVDDPNHSEMTDLIWTRTPEAATYYCLAKMIDSGVSADELRERAMRAAVLAEDGEAHAARLALCCGRIKANEEPSSS